MRGALAALAFLALGGCLPKPPGVYAPPPGVHEMVEGPIEGAPAKRLILGDLNLPGGGTIQRHYHHGEEYIYVLGGSATVSRQGMPDVTLRPGQSIVIPTGVVHWGVVGPKGLRSISAWVKDESKPLREAIAP